MKGRYLFGRSGRARKAPFISPGASSELRDLDKKRWNFSRHEMRTRELIETFVKMQRNPLPV